jgi:thiol-disulfide isomerase/thioredoxin
VAASPSFIARLGATLFAPRRLARRDLDAHDGKAGDDLMALSVLALVIDGASHVVGAAHAVAAGRHNTALHAVAEMMKPAVPLFAAWAVASAAFALFTLRAPKKAPGELGARVTSALILVSLLVAPFVSLLDLGPLRYTLEMLPWGVAAVVFGIVLREAIDDGGVERPIGHRMFGAGSAIAVAIAASALFLFGTAVENSGPAPQGTGAVAANIDQPLLNGGRFDLSAQRGRPVVLTFWATWCPPCIKELPVLEKLYRGQATLYAINVDEAGPDRERTVQQTVQRLGLTMPVVLDDGRSAQQYNIASIPTLVRIGADGKIAQIYDRPLDEPELRDALRP